MDDYVNVNLSYHANVTLSYLNSTLKNDSQSVSQDVPSGSYIEWGATSAFISFFVLLANSVVIFAFYKKRSLLRQPSNKILLSLALSDFAGGLVISLHSIALLVPELRYPTTTNDFTFRIATELITTTLQLTTLFHLCLLTIDRYMALFVALRYRQIANGKRVVRLTIGAWLFSAFIAAVQLSWLYRVLDADISYEDSQVLDLVECRYSIFVLVVFVLIPLILIGAMYVRIYLETKRLLRHPVTRIKPALKKEIRITWIYTTIYILICIYCLPYFIMRLFVDLKAVHGEVSNINPFGIHLATNFKYLIHLANPLIYAIRKRDIKRALNITVIRPLRGFLSCQNQEDGLYRCCCFGCCNGQQTGLPKTSASSDRSVTSPSANIELQLLSTEP